MENYAMNYEKEKKIYTVADIEALPEGERAELIDGEMFMMASPTMTHQRISRKLMVSIDEYIRSKGGDCEVFAAPFSLFPDESGRNYLEPDLAVLCLFRGRGCANQHDRAQEERDDFSHVLFLLHSSGPVHSVRNCLLIKPTSPVS